MGDGYLDAFVRESEAATATLNTWLLAADDGSRLPGGILGGSPGRSGTAAPGDGADVSDVETV